MGPVTLEAWCNNVCFLLLLFFLCPFVTTQAPGYILYGPDPGILHDCGVDVLILKINLSTNKNNDNIKIKKELMNKKIHIYI